MKLRAWSRTDTGRKRERNEDSLLLEEPLGLFAVADGMGGHRGGAHASRLALDVLRRQVEARAAPLEDEPDDASSFEDSIALSDTAEIPKIGPDELSQGDHGASAMEVLRLSARAASSAVYEAARDEPSLRGMGTTLTAMLLHGDRAHMVHAGDSRAYLYRDSRADQLTEDHSWTREQVKAGMMTETEAETSQFRHIITRSIGFERDVRLDTKEVDVQPGDCFLLCSDGMSNHVGREELERLMSSTAHEELPALLVKLANERGGDDNVTVVVVQVGGDTGE